MFYNKVTGIVPESPCWKCGKMLNQATSYDGHTASPNAMTVCFGCGALSCFDDNLQLRKVTASDIAHLESDPEAKYKMQVYIAAVKLAHQNVNKRKAKLN